MTLPAKNKWVGSRYVPIPCGEHDKTKEYENLSVVQSGGDSYTSRINVPIGVDINNSTFWVRSAIYNQQLEIYREEVLNYSGELNNSRGAFNSLYERLNNSDTNMTINNQKLKEVISLNQFPRLEGELNDSQRIQRLLDYAKLNNYKFVTIDGGQTYQIDETINVPVGLYIECGIDTIFMAMTSSLVVFKFYDFDALKMMDSLTCNNMLSNCIIRKNTGLTAVSAILINGRVGMKFTNIYIDGLDIGVSFTNTLETRWSELNKFNNIHFNNTTINILMDGTVTNGGGYASYHGNVFENCYSNLNDGQTFLKLTTNALLYNYRINANIWYHSHNTKLLDVGYNCSMEEGTIDIKSEFFGSGGSVSAFADINYGDVDNIIYTNGTTQLKRSNGGKIIIRANGKIINPKFNYEGLNKSNLLDEFKTDIINKSTLYSVIGNLKFNGTFDTAGTFNTTTFKNYLMNGDFRFWDAPSTFPLGWTATGTHTATKVIEKINNNITTLLSVNFSSLDNNGVEFLSVPIHDYKNLSNKTVTLSFYLKDVQNFEGLQLMYNLNGSSPTLLTSVPIVIPVVGKNTWTFKFIDFPDSLTNSSGSVFINFEVKRRLSGITEGAKFKIYNVQLEEGVVGTPFEIKPSKLEELMIQ